jgi:hypothetical protein
VSAAYQQLNQHTHVMASHLLLHAMCACLYYSCLCFSTTCLCHTGVLQVSQEVLDHIAEGLHQIAQAPRNRKKGERGTTEAWGDKMRQLLTQPDHQAALEALQLPAQEVAANVQQVLQDIVSGARQPDASSGTAAAGGGVRWYGIRLSDQGTLQQQLGKLLQQQGRGRSRSSTPQQQQQQQQEEEEREAAADEGGAAPMEVEPSDFPSEVRVVGLMLGAIRASLGLLLSAGLAGCRWQSDLHVTHSPTLVDEDV